MTDTKKDKIIHLGYIREAGKPETLVLLKETNPKHYSWFQTTSDNKEIQTSIHAHSIEEALRLASRQWKMDQFRTVNCGFRYTLPERDEHGTNALFYQMAASYAAMNGVYFDEELSCNCIVHNASTEARSIWKTLVEQGK